MIFWLVEALKLQFSSPRAAEALAEQQLNAAFFLKCCLKKVVSRIGLIGIWFMIILGLDIRSSFCFYFIKLF